MARREGSTGPAQGLQKSATSDMVAAIAININRKINLMREVDTGVG